MTNDQLKKAQDAGCVTAQETAIWYAGYEKGQADTYAEVTEDIEEGFPLFAEESIKLNDEAYEKASSNAGELI